MIGISTITANTDGDIVIYETPDSKLLDLQPRISRVATLDGGAVLTHSGFAHGDRTLAIKATDISEADAAKLRSLVENETLLYFSLSDGFFSGMIQRLVIDNGALQMTVLLKEKLSS